MIAEKKAARKIIAFIARFARIEEFGHAAHVNKIANIIYEETNEDTKAKRSCRLREQRHGA